MSHSSSSISPSSSLPARQEATSGAGVHGDRCTGATTLSAPMEQWTTSVSGVQLFYPAGLQAAGVSKPNTTSASAALHTTGGFEADLFILCKSTQIITSEALSWTETFISYFSSVDHSDLLLPCLSQGQAAATCCPQSTTLDGNVFVDPAFINISQYAIQTMDTALHSWRQVSKALGCGDTNTLCIKHNKIHPCSMMPVSSTLVHIESIHEKKRYFIKFRWYKDNGTEKGGHLNFYNVLGQSYSHKQTQMTHTVY